MNNICVLHCVRQESNSFIVTIIDSSNKVNSQIGYSKSTDEMFIQRRFPKSRYSNCRGEIIFHQSIVRQTTPELQ